VGAKLTSVRTVLGLRIEGATEVIEYQPNAKRVTKGAGGPFQVTATQIFEAVGGGMRLTFHAEAKVGGLFMMVEGIIAKEIDKMLASYLRKLKSILDTS